MSVVILQSRRFWVLYLAAALIATLAAFQLMFNSMPVLKVDIEFSRAEAVAAAAQLQQQHFPDLKTERSAAVFVSNRGLQNYVELEAGGVEAYNNLIANVDAMTHYWKVRRFAESQEKELTSVFSPKGVPLSFWLTIPDQEPGATLEEAAAREIAERGARDFLGERFNVYKPFESVVRHQTTGRTDYSFTYEHESLKLVEARFRLVLKVAGDKLVGIDTLSHIPEAFDQRFDEMRAVNNHISQVANYLMFGLLVLGGLVGGGIWLHRRHQLRWKPAFLLAVTVATGLAASVISNLPMSWMAYATTVSANNFLLQQVAGAGMVLLAYTLGLALIYCVAEGLSRMAFAGHPKLFDFLRKPVAASPEAMGRVLGAYGWAGFFLLYAMTFQLISRNFGWWSPTDTETDPNILASLRPALGPIFQALQAGTWEECLFRAVPLALAAMIGKRFGIRTPLIVATLVLQALIFGGAHANYANLPGYSRLVELFIPALAFGLVYLRFGLVVGMLTHFLYDLVLMSLPIFLSNDPSLVIDKVLVVLVGMAPLLAVLWARYTSGAALPLADEWRNGVPADLTNIDQVYEAQADEQQVHTELPHTDENLSLKPISLSAKLWLPLVIIAVIAIVMAWCKPPQINWPQYSIDRAQAKAMAVVELAKHGAKLEGAWHSTVMTHSGWRQPMDFVWRETDKQTFERLTGSYLDNPLWQVTWRKFDGPVEERSEEWSVYLEADGRLHEVAHTLPEGRVGAKLSREQATAKALGWIVAQQWGNANQLEEKSVEETVRPARSDWVVKYIDKAAFNQKDGQAIIRITLNGDEVAGAVRTIDVPDKWSRAEAEKNAKKTPFNMAAGLAMLILAGLALSTFFRKHTGRKINVRVALPWIALCVSANLVVGILWFDGAFGSFAPTMGWNLQLWMNLGGKLLGAGALGVFLLFMAQAVHAERPLANGSIRTDLMLGTVLAILLASLYAVVGLLFPSKETPPIYAADWSTYIPWLTVIFNGLKAFLKIIIVIILALGAVRFLRSRLKVILCTALLLVFCVVSTLAADEVGIAFVKQGLFVFSLVLSIELIRRKQLGVLIAMSGVGIALGQASIANALYAGAWLHALISAICCLLVTYGLLRHWHRNRVA